MAESAPRVPFEVECKGDVAEMLDVKVKGCQEGQALFLKVAP